MKIFLIISIFIFFLFGCSSNTDNIIKARGRSNIDFNKTYSFNEYVKKLSKISKINPFPNINNIPD